jgi:DNA helicase-2/ATP-dependent DNA helicase PcrA
MRDILRSLGDAPTLEAFLQELQMRSKESLLRPNTVTLMTIHGAKGKEFDHVYLIGMVEDELPSFQSRKKGDQSPEMEEERRNCFVAITRTIETLTISYAEIYRCWPKKPSRFLFEMKLLKNKNE